MDSLSFISSFIQSIAWPSVLLIIIFVLRQSISELLSSLSRLKYKQIELEFRKEFSEIEIKANRALVKKSELEQKVVEEIVKPGGNAETNVSLRTLISLDQEVEIVAEISPKAAISLSWLIVERELLGTVIRLDFSPDSTQLKSASQNTQLLKSANLIDEEMVKVLDGMRMLRNKYCHAQIPESIITIEDAKEYGKLAKRIVSKLNVLNGE